MFLKVSRRSLHPSSSGSSATDTTMLLDHILVMGRDDGRGVTSGEGIGLGRGVSWTLVK